MKISKLIVITLVWIVLILPRLSNANDGFSLEFDDKYFVENSGGNPIFSGNTSEIIFDNNQNLGFGVFFLGTGLSGNTVTLHIEGNSTDITCKKQLNGYYSINFTDFAMFPLDSQTQNSIHDTGIDYITGGLYYDCYRQSTQNVIYTGVYGYIERKYLTGEGNSHRIRAGLQKANNNYIRAQNSPLEIVYSNENSRNENRALSGTFLTNIVNTGIVIPKFFGDFQISNAESNGTPRQTHYTIDRQKYNNGNVMFYLKSTHTGSKGQIKLTGYNSQGSIIIITGYTTNHSQRQRDSIYWNNTLTNTKSAYGFYGYTGFVFTGPTELSSGEIYIKISKNNTEYWEKNITFNISGTDAETFSVTYNTGGCYSGINVQINPSNGYEYKRGDDEWTGTSQKYFTENRSGQIQIKTGQNIFSGSNLYINITNIDNTHPSITGIWIGSNFPYECSTGTIKIQAQDNGCGSGNITINLSGTNLCSGATNLICTGNTQLSHSGTQTINYTATDSVGNTITGSLNISVQDSKLTGHDFRIALEEYGNQLIASGNRKDLSEANAGDCETISVTHINCNGGGTGNTGQSNMFTYKIRNNYQGDYWCNLTITDGDTTKTITGHFFDCSNDQNGCIPTLTPIFISGINYIQYPENDSDTHTGKYTSGTNVMIKINGDSVYDISGYRVSCIKEDIYCTNLQEWTTAENSDPNFHEKRSGAAAHFREINGTGRKICHDWQNARSERKPYPNPDTFTRDLNEGSGCDHYDIPYGSNNEGERQIYIQIIDIKGKKSDITPTDIINYATQNPIPSTSTDNDWGSIGSQSQNMANQTSFNTIIDINGADLPNGASGLNDKFREYLSRTGLITSRRNRLWMIEEPTNRRILSRYKRE